MLFVAESNLIALVLGLLIGVITAFWAFRRRPGRPQPSADDIDSRAQETPRS